MNPSTWTIPGGAMKVHGDDLVDDLRLAVGLGVECHAQMELDAGELEEVTP